MTERRVGKDRRAQGRRGHGGAAQLWREGRKRFIGEINKRESTSLSTLAMDSMSGNLLTEVVPFCF